MTSDQALEAMAACDYWNGRKSMSATESPDDAYQRGRAEVADWIAYADKLERVLELVCGESKDRLMQTHAEQGLRIVRPLPRCP